MNGGVAVAGVGELRCCCSWLTPPCCGIYRACSVVERHVARTISLLLGRGGHAQAVTLVARPVCDMGVGHCDVDWLSAYMVHIDRLSSDTALVSQALLVMAYGQRDVHRHVLLAHRVVLTVDVCDVFYMGKTRVGFKDVTRWRSTDTVFIDM